MTSNGFRPLSPVNDGAEAPAAVVYVSSTPAPAQKDGRTSYPAPGKCATASRRFPGRMPVMMRQRY